MVPTKLKIKGNKSFSLLGSLDTEEDLSKTWRLMTKVKEALEYGMRLENLSWRLWFMHHLMVHDQKTKTKFRRLSTVTTKKLETEKATNLKDLAVPIYRGTNNSGKAGGNANYGINNNIQNIMNGKKNSNNKKKSNKKNKQQQQKINNNNNDNVKSDSSTTNNSNGINSTNNNNNNNNNNTITTSTIYDNNNTSTEIVTPTEPEFPFQATTNYVNNSNSKIEVDYSNNLIDPHDPNVDSPPMDTEILMDGMDGMDELSIPNGDMELIEHELIYYTLHQFTNDQSRFQVIQLPNDYSAPFRTSALIDPDNGPTMEIDITSMIENSGNLTDDSNLQYHTHHDSHNLSSHHHHHPHHHHHQQLTSINDQIVTTASSSSTNSRIHDAVYVGNNGTQASNLPPPLDTNIISSALSGSNGNNGGNNNNNPLNTPLNTPVSCLPTSGVLGNGNLIYANQFSADQNSSPTATTNTTATNNNNVYNNNNNATTSIPISPPISSSSTLKNNYSSSKKSISSSSSSSPPQQEQRSTSTTPTETLSLPFSNNNNSNSDNNNTSSNINNSSRNSNSSNSNCNIKSDSNNNVNNNGTRNSSQSLQVSENRVKKSSSGNGEQQCHNCGVTSTPLWRRSTNDELLCNACGLYLKLHKMSRPKTMKPHIVRKDARDDEASQPRCSNCGTMTTPLWRRDEEGQTLCNACGLYFKLHHERRPLSMKTDVIKKRQRYENGQTPNRRVGKKLKANESQQQNLQDDVDHSNNQQGDLNNQSQVNKDSKPLMTFSKPSSKNTNSSLNISSNLNSINLTTSTITTTTTTSSSSSSNNSNNVNNNNIVQSLSI